MTGRSTRLCAAAIVGTAALALAGCTATENQASSAPESSSGARPVKVALRPFYDQLIDWSSCGDFECGTAQVPLDYADPDAGSIELVLKRAPPTGADPIGSLLINPGGPGASGVDLVARAVTMFGKDVLAAYDVVGFDPRGVAGSNPVTCFDDAANDAFLSQDFDFATDAGIAEAKAAYAARSAACAANTGPLLGHVDTASSARDMDVLRAALGDTKLTYLGYSYGTALGATYAGLFPDKVGRMVLDGALDPTLSSADYGLGQAAGVEGALRAYVTSCRTGANCPLTGTVDDGLAQIENLLDGARRSPLPTASARVLTSTLAYNGILATLYDDASWKFLTQALTEAIHGNDGSVLLHLADSYNKRDKSGTYTTNSNEAFTAINCLDSVSSADPAVMRAEAAALEAVAPTVGYFFGYHGMICADWPYPPTGVAGVITANGAAPIVVIGTTNDPATPYAWAENLAKDLASGVLLTYDGDGHTAYGRSNECILNAVDTYLVTGTPPADGTHC